VFKHNEIVGVIRGYERGFKEFVHARQGLHNLAGKNIVIIKCSPSESRGQQYAQVPPVSEHIAAHAIRVMGVMLLKLKQC
jgi:hypothetical protein